MEESFEPATKAYLGGQYRLLIVDGHASHVSSEFIKFTRAHKIMSMFTTTFHNLSMLVPSSKITRSFFLKKLVLQPIILIKLILFR